MTILLLQKTLIYLKNNPEIAKSFPGTYNDSYNDLPIKSYLQFIDNKNTNRHNNRPLFDYYEKIQ